jgi:hypothetical protein
VITALQMIGAVVDPMGKAPVHTPIAKARRDSGQPTRATDTDAGTTKAPPMPCSTRPATRTAGLGAKTQISEAKAKIAAPVWKARSVPMRAASVPPSIVSAARTME